MDTQGIRESFQLRHPEKTVYVLGAGFSSLAGIPIMASFFPEAMKRLKRPLPATPPASPSETSTPPSTPNPGRHADYARIAQNLANIVREYRPLRDVVNIDPDNLEHLFCLLDLRSGVQERQREQLIEAIVQIVGQPNCSLPPSSDSPTTPLRCRVARRHLHRPDLHQPPSARDAHCCHLEPTAQGRGIPTRQRSPGSVCIYDAFVSKILSDNASRDRVEGITDLDAIVSLNYDLLIERSCASFPTCSIYYGNNVVTDDLSCWCAQDDCRRLCLCRELTDARRNVLPLLKLHGSINWQIPTAPHGPPHMRAADAAAPAAISEQACLVPMTPGTATLTSAPSGKALIIPPTFRKGAPAGSVFDRIAAETIAHLRRAARIVFIGYSIPPTDTYFRFILAAGLATPEIPRVEVWNLTVEESQKPIRDAFGPLYANPGGPHAAVCHAGGLCEFVCGSVCDMKARRR